jgi:nucleotide-binding universal stress UspA family protein
MKEILIPFDFSRHSQRALELALAGYPFGTDVNLTVVHMLDAALYDRVMPGRPLPPVSTVEGFLNAEVAKASAQSPPKIAKVTVHVMTGRVLGELASLLRSAAYDGAVIGGQGHGGAAEALLGTTARRLVRQTTVPIYVVKRANETTVPKKVLCAVALDESMRAALLAGRNLARKFDTTLETLTVIQTDAWPYVAHFPADYTGQLSREWKDGAMKACASAEKRLRDLETEILGELVSKAQHADYGPVTSSIVRHCEHYDTILLAAQQEARPAFMTFGTTIEGVLERATTDVMIAR